MTAITSAQDRSAFISRLTDSDWIVACLCAAWCDICSAYRAGFDELAKRHPDKVFLWIDIEDDANLVGDIDVDNFPTLLMQRGDIIAFFGAMLPDARIAERVLISLVTKTNAELLQEASGTKDGNGWQGNVNLRQRLNENMNSHT